MTTTTETTADHLTELDIVLIYARDAVHVAENAECCARIALNAAVNTGDTDAKYRARCALSAAIVSTSTARATFSKLRDFSRKTLEERAKTLTV